MEKQILEKGNCVYLADNKPMCDGLYCRPHPCNYFLGMSDEDYQVLVQFTIDAEVKRIKHIRLHASNP